ncbi:MAG TPA: 16S rRNA (guanine(527)-N(7))-methyltransferase RsmG [Solirubrobacteraceae bacterium]|nr:16S rRNA (guanine(527)-N(7))-methyltransferase RsmG [Solirubrobacteraceae bacterium]
MKSSDALGPLSPAQRSQVEALLLALRDDDEAPTTVRDPARAVDVHLGDSLVALELDVVRAATRIADLGSGAGFPGLALAVALPGAEVALVESQRRKCEFLERALAAARIANARVVCSRVEEWREGFDVHDVVLARALAAQAVVLEYAAPLLREGGTLVDWRGRRSGEEERSAAGAAAELGLRLIEIRHVEPYAGAREHHLHLYAKVAPTPPRFPRRPGIARKRPLGC